MESVPSVDRMDVPLTDSVRDEPSFAHKLAETVSQVSMLLISSTGCNDCIWDKQRYQLLLDQSVPHTAVRWISTGLLIVAYMVRVLILQGWYIVTYALGIYYLNLLIAFLTPKADPVLDDDMGMFLLSSVLTIGRFLTLTFF